MKRTAGAFIMGCLIAASGFGTSTALAVAPPASSDKVTVERVIFKNP